MGLGPVQTETGVATHKQAAVWKPRRGLVPNIPHDGTSFLDCQPQNHAEVNRCCRSCQPAAFGDTSLCALPSLRRGTQIEERWALPASRLWRRGLGSVQQGGLPGASAPLSPQHLEQQALAPRPAPWPGRVLFLKTSQPRVQTVLQETLTVAQFLLRIMKERWVL